MIYSSSVEAALFPVLYDSDPVSGWDSPNPRAPVHVCLRVGSVPYVQILHSLFTMAGEKLDDLL